MAESGSEPGAAHPRPRLTWAVRTARATRTPLMLDRFELVLLLVVITIAVQGLVDVSGSVVARLFANAISGLALLLPEQAAWPRSVPPVCIGSGAAPSTSSWSSCSSPASRPSPSVGAATSRPCLPRRRGCWLRR